MTPIDQTKHLATVQYEYIRQYDHLSQRIAVIDNELAHPRGGDPIRRHILEERRADLEAELEPVIDESDVVRTALYRTDLPVKQRSWLELRFRELQNRRTMLTGRVEAIVADMVTNEHTPVDTSGLAAQRASLVAEQAQAFAEIVRINIALSERG